MGNWWNQELFGKPTTLPWALKIDEVHRPEAYATVATFHPTFLYESLWNLALCAALIWIDRKYTPRAGRLFAMYVAGYTFARFFLERLRVDPAFKVAGLRVNEWVSAVAFVASVAYIVLGPKGEPELALAERDPTDGDASEGDPADGSRDDGDLDDGHVPAPDAVADDAASDDAATPDASGEAVLGVPQVVSSTTVGEREPTGE